MLRYALALMIFAAAGAGAWTLAPRLAALAEARYAAQVDAALQASGFGWARSQVDGLAVIVSGPAPSAAAATEALSIVSALSPALSVTNAITAAPKIARTVIPPHLEILKGADALILTGVVTDEAMTRPLGGDATMLTYGAAPFGPDWTATRPILSDIAAALRHVRITVGGGMIRLTGLAPTRGARDELDQPLEALQLLGWIVEAAIDAPPDVVTDFRLIAKVAPDAPPAITCAASSQANADAIRHTALAQLNADITCAIGAGAPDGGWAAASQAALTTLAALPSATVEMAGKTVTLTAGPPTMPDALQAAKDALTAGLPTGYRLVVDDRTSTAAAPVPPFQLTIDWPGGGQPLAITSAQSGGGLDGASQSLGAYARALFPGASATFTSTDGQAPPTGWRRATRTGLEALGSLTRGGVTITAGEIILTGAAAEVRDIRTAHEKLATAGDGWRVTTRIAHDPSIIAAAQPLPPNQCAGLVTETIEEAPISFQPASATLTQAGSATVDRIAAILIRCEEARFEIGGHTDAQGSEGGNLALSRSRAEAVLSALITAKAPPGRLIATGYGEARPIADNATAVGRALNRRIEFTLIEDPE